MALGDPYITWQELGGYMDEIDLTVDDPTRDEQLQDAVDAASREITKVAGRDFNKADSPSKRVYIPSATSLVKTDDFFTTTGLVIQITYNGQPQGDPLTANQFELFPLNRYINGEERPYTGFRLPFPTYHYLWVYNRIEVTAQWGWDSIPADIAQATKIRAAELYKLRDAPLGAITVGSGSANYTLKARPVPHWKQLAQAYARTERKLYLG